MKKFKVVIEWATVVEAKTKEDVYNVLGERLAMKNSSGVQEFWDNLKIEELKEARK